jgi:hypothetical protein
VSFPSTGEDLKAQEKLFHQLIPAFSIAGLIVKIRRCNPCLLLCSRTDVSAYVHIGIRSLLHSSRTVLRPIYLTLRNFLRLCRKALDTCWVFLISELHAGTQLPSCCDPDIAVEETHRITNQNATSNFAETAVSSDKLQDNFISNHVSFTELKKGCRTCYNTIRIAVGNTEVNTKYVPICVKNGCLTRITA